jgi:hypothetical protein
MPTKLLKLVGKYFCFLLYLCLVQIYQLINLRTAVAITCKDGVVLAVEKIVTSKLYEPGVNKRIFIIDQHIGMVNI